jgi:hypothetical protein
LNRENHPYGKDYKVASGYFRVTADHDGGNRVSLRFTPEIHHGPVQRSYQAIAHATPYAPQQFKINDGQQEEALADLAASLALEPGQVVVIGCRPERRPEAAEADLGLGLTQPAWRNRRETSEIRPTQTYRRAEAKGSECKQGRTAERAQNTATGRSGRHNGDPLTPGLKEPNTWTETSDM